MWFWPLCWAGRLGIGKKKNGPKHIASDVIVRRCRRHRLPLYKILWKSLVLVANDAIQKQECFSDWPINNRPQKAVSWTGRSHGIPRQQKSHKYIRMFASSSVRDCIFDYSNSHSITSHLTHNRSTISIVAAIAKTFCVRYGNMWRTRTTTATPTWHMTKLIIELFYKMSSARTVIKCNQKENTLDQAKKRVRKNKRRTSVSHFSNIIGHSL